MLQRYRGLQKRGWKFSGGRSEASEQFLCLNLKRTNKFKIITTTTPTVGLYHYHRRDRDLFQAEVPGRPFF